MADERPAFLWRRVGRNRGYQGQEYQRPSKQYKIIISVHRAVRPNCGGPFCWPADKDKPAKTWIVPNARFSQKRVVLKSPALNVKVKTSGLAAITIHSLTRSTEGHHFKQDWRSGRHGRFLLLNSVKPSSAQRATNSSWIMGPHPSTAALRTECLLIAVSASLTLRML